MSRIQSSALRTVARLWHEARGTRRMPSWADLPSDLLSANAKRLWGFRYDPQTGIFTGGLAGDRYRRWIGENFVGSRLEDTHPRSSYGEAQQLLTRIVATPLAGRSSGCLFTVGDVAVTGERIALPLAADGHTGDGILGASDYAPPPLLGPWAFVYENVEWYEI